MDTDRASLCGILALAKVRAPEEPEKHCRCTVNPLEVKCLRSDCSLFLLHQYSILVFSKGF
jgi:hypothetical protein